MGFLLRKAAVPIARGAARLAAHAGKSSWDLLSEGGEDYELLFTIQPPSRSGNSRLSIHLGQIGATPIGEVIPEKEEILVEGLNGDVTPLGAAGYEHFRTS
jgi:thiamine-monophosphate kinase